MAGCRRWCCESTFALLSSEAQRLSFRSLTEAKKDPDEESGLAESSQKLFEIAWAASVAPVDKTASVGPLRETSMQSCGVRWVAVFHTPKG